MADEPTTAAPQPVPLWRVVWVAAGVLAIGAGGVVITTIGGEVSLPADADRSMIDARGSEGTSARLKGLIVREGDAVSAAGIVVDGPGDPLLCRTNPMVTIAHWPGEELPPSCSTLAVPLTGIEEIELPVWIERHGVRFTDGGVVVTGTWQDGALAVDAVAVADPAPSGLERWEVPCAPPTGGWAGWDGLPPNQPFEYFEAVAAALAGVIDTQPERFHANWIGYPDGNPDDAPTNDMGEPQFEHTVMIVSTVDDPSEVQAELATVYPGNLCVVQVEHSLADLAAVVGRLAVADGSWVLDEHSLDASVDNKVQLALPVLDERAAARIGADADLVEVSPLLRRA